MQVVNVNKIWLTWYITVHVFSLEKIVTKKFIIWTSLVWVYRKKYIFFGNMSFTWFATRRLGKCKIYFGPSVLMNFIYFFYWINFHFVKVCNFFTTIPILEFRSILSFDKAEWEPKPTKTLSQGIISYIETLYIKFTMPSL